MISVTPEWGPTHSRDDYLPASEAEHGRILFARRGTTAGRELRKIGRRVSSLTMEERAQSAWTAVFRLSLSAVERGNGSRQRTT